MSFLDQAFHIERPDADLYAEVVGPADGEAIYYLHGGPGYSSHSFRDLMGDDLERYRMLYVDQRGGGRSYAHGPFDLDTLADDVVAVLDALELPAASLLAHGFGATVAARTASRYPERVARLLLVNPWFSMPLLARDLQRTAAHESGHADAALPPEAALAAGGSTDLPPDGDRAGADLSGLEPDGLLTQAFGWLPAKTLLDRMQFPDPASRLRLEHSDSSALFGPDTEIDPDDLWHLDVLDDLTERRAPTVIIAGRRDRTSFPEQVEAGLLRMPDALVSLLDAGHYPWLDRPQEFLEVLDDAMKLPPAAGRG